MNDKKKNIYIPIEIKHREYLSKLFFSFYAIKAGFRIYIGSKRSIYKILNKKKQKEGIFFYKSGIEKNRLTKIKKKCDRIVILDQELGTVKNKLKN
jgi:hypothetical protein